MANPKKASDPLIDPKTGVADPKVLARRKVKSTRKTKAKAMEADYPGTVKKVEKSKDYDPWQAEKTLGRLRKPDRYQ